MRNHKGASQSHTGQKRIPNANSQHKACSCTILSDLVKMPAQGTRITFALRGNCTGQWENAYPQTGVCLVEHRASILPELLPLLRTCLIPLSALGIGHLVSVAGVFPSCLGMRSDGLITLQACTIASVLSSYTIKYSPQVQAKQRACS